MELRRPQLSTQIKRKSIAVYGIVVSVGPDIISGHQYGGPQTLVPLLNVSVTQMGEKEMFYQSHGVLDPPITMEESGLSTMANQLVLIPYYLVPPID